MTTKELLIEKMPKEIDFRVCDVVDLVYPNLVSYDTEGRKFNRGCGTVARMLRTIRGVQEVEYGLFYAHIEFFKS